MVRARKGKRVIKTMALGETSSFLQKKENKTYSEILASMNKKNKPGYRMPRIAYNYYCCIDLKKAWKDR